MEQIENAASPAPVHGIVTMPMPFKPYYDEDGITIYSADCKQVLPFIGRVDVLLTDPPYGLRNAEGRRMHAYRDPEKSKGKIGGDGATQSKEYGNTSWDAEPISQEQWAQLQEISASQIVWGVEYQIAVLGRPPRWLCWDKKCKNGWDDSFSDFELAYFSDAGQSKMYRHRWMGMISDSKEKRVHPTQKPLALMRWCLSLVPEAQTVLDPFMGSGTTLVAARLEGRKAIGIEISERYCEAAANRLAQRTLF